METEYHSLVDIPLDEIVKGIAMMGEDPEELWNLFL